MTLTPSYGRDYRSAQAVTADFKAGKDFTVASGQWTGSQCNIRDVPDGESVTLRYAKLSKALVLRVFHCGDNSHCERC